MNKQQQQQQALAAGRGGADGGQAAHLKVTLEVAPMTRKVDRLTARPRMAVLATAVMTAGVYWKPSRVSGPRSCRPRGSNRGTRMPSSRAAQGLYWCMSCMLLACSSRCLLPAHTWATAPLSQGRGRWACRLRMMWMFQPGMRGSWQLGAAGWSQQAEGCKGCAGTG